MENGRENGLYRLEEVSWQDPMTADILEELVKINGDKVCKRYVREGFLGKGGFAECYMTYNKETNKRVATKIIPKQLLESPRTKLRVLQS